MKPRVFVMDDSPDNLQVLEEILAGAGYHVHAFASPLLGMRAAADNPPDLFLLDVMMPELSGFDCCSRLKEDTRLRDIPVMFISALNSPGDKVRAFQAGAVDYVCKPFYPEEVLARIGTHLRLETRHHELRDAVPQAGSPGEMLEQPDRIRGNLFRMLSHELRTPANGLLVSGELLAEEADDPRLVNIFDQSAKRMLNLIEDMELIASLTDRLQDGIGCVPLSLVWETTRREPFPANAADGGHCVRAEPELLRKGLEILADLAGCFREKDSRTDLRPRHALRDSFLELEYPLENLRLSPDELENFFRMESNCRTATAAEQLGLAPSAAFQLFTLMGGELSIRKISPSKGVLLLKLPLAPCT